MAFQMSDCEFLQTYYCSCCLCVKGWSDSQIEKTDLLFIILI